MQSDIANHVAWKPKLNMYGLNPFPKKKKRQTPLRQLPKGKTTIAPLRQKDFFSSLLLTRLCIKSASVSLKSRPFSLYKSSDGSFGARSVRNLPW